MNESWLVILVLSLFLLRPLWLWQLWRAPLKQGEGRFLGIEVEPGFYRRAGAVLLRRYRAWMVAPLAVEALILLALILSGRWILAMYEHVPATAILVVWSSFTTYQFIERVRILSPAALATAQSPHGVRLSLAPRRLRDHSNWVVEAVIFGLTLLTLLWLAAQWLGWFPEPPNASLFKTVIFILYMQAGVLLLKQVFVRWRMKFPLRRVDDYRRWRAAWLSYHLRVFDAVRLLLAFVLWGILAFKTFKSWWGAEQMKPPGLALALVSLAVYIFYCVRERRRLEAVAREIRPIELIKEYPPPSATPAPEGRFLAGGLFYFNRDNPVIVTRSPQGLAINLASRGAYLWVAYLAGLVWLVVWQVGN
ncbi:MAG TPA: hypothetical protein VJ810_28960 [Blastocatellia bacterium]|nr:hypothetical protein [Blastocatellia bacterium]